MDVILSGWAWLPTKELDRFALDNLKQELTKTPKVARDYEDMTESEPVEMYLERDGFIGVPRQYFLEKAVRQHEIHDERSAGLLIDQDRCSFLGATSGHERWDEQTKAIEEIRKEFGSGSAGGIVQAVPAWGKTAFAIRLICSLGRKTFIGVHKEFLVEQWKLRLEKFAPYLRLGVWQGKKEEVEDRDVVIGMIQTLAKRDVEKEVADQFGLCIWDEVHRVGARTWGTVPPKFNPRFHMGLSARPQRADRMEDVFLWLIGPVLFKATYQTPVPNIYRIPTPYVNPEWIRKYEADPTKKKLIYPTYLKAMVASQVRNKRIVDELEKILRAKVGRKIVVMSERIEHLEDMASMLRERDMVEKIPDLSTGFIHSKIGQKARKEAERKRVVFSTFQMLDEGFDISALDTLMMTTGRAYVEQAIGRIRRECVVGRTVTETDCKYYCPWRVGRCKSKPKPIVVEFTDPEVSAVMGKVKYRSRYYREIGATVLEAKG